jgi:hypothetical protein
MYHGRPALSDSCSVIHTIKSKPGYSAGATMTVLFSHFSILARNRFPSAVCIGTLPHSLILSLASTCNLTTAYLSRYPNRRQPLILATFPVLAAGFDAALLTYATTESIRLRSQASEMLVTSLRKIIHGRRYTYHLRDSKGKHNDR